MQKFNSSVCFQFSYMSLRPLSLFFYSIIQLTNNGNDFQCTVAMMGYGPEDKSTVLELMYNYGVHEYDKGNGYAQVSFMPRFKRFNRVGSCRNQLV